MKVLKFGGTSVGSVKSILCLKRIVEKEAKRQPVVVVVSALGGITDKLLSTAQLALNGDESYKEEFDAMVARHHQMIDTIFTEPKTVEKHILRRLPHPRFKRKDPERHRKLRRTPKLKHHGRADKEREAV